MKKAGWILIAISAVIIFYNTVIVDKMNEKEANAHPWQTLFSWGGNLKPSYTFGPPYSGFEIFIIGIGITGIALAVIGHNQEQKEEQERRRQESDSLANKS